MAQFVAQWPDGFIVRWRNLNKAEYKQFRTAYETSRFAEPIDVALELYQTVLQEGPDPKHVPAGIPAFIAKHQLVDNPYSGQYEHVQPAINMARHMVQNDYLMAATALIASTLNYRPEEIEQWDPNTFFIRLAQTEIALGRPFEPVDPKAPKDARGNPINDKKIKKPLTDTQRKAIARSRDRVASGRG